MNPQIMQFLNWAEQTKKMAPNTLEAYKRDILGFVQFLESRGVSALEEAGNADVVAFLLKLKREGKSAATENRKLSSLRGFYAWMKEEGNIADNPAAELRSPKIERKELEYLTIEEVDRFLSLPDDSAKGMRDRAILEVLYATGIRVSEIIEANLTDINLRLGFVTCTGEYGKARIIPMGRPAKAALEAYIYDARPQIVKSDSQNKALFVNYLGKRLTRQGIWKILKEYAKLAGIESKITPQTLRNSFAVHMVQNGADLKAIQELLGFEDPAAMQVYLNVTKSKIKEVYDKTHPRA